MLPGAENKSAAVSRRNEERRRRWNAEARADIKRLLRSKGNAAARARAVLAACDVAGVPESWAIAAALEAFMLPRPVPLPYELAALDAPHHMGLRAAEQWLTAKKAPGAEAFRQAALTWAGERAAAKRDD